MIRDAPAGSAGAVWFGGVGAFGMTVMLCVTGRPVPQGACVVGDHWEQEKVAESGGSCFEQRRAGSSPKRPMRPRGKSIASFLFTVCQTCGWLVQM